MAHRFSGKGQPYEGLTVIRRGKRDWAGFARFVPEMLSEPLTWKKPARVFVNSMSDLFHPSLSNEEIAAVFGVMAACPQHTFQVLTKQPERAAEWFEWAYHQRCHGNTTAEVMRDLAIGAGRFRRPDGSMPKGPGYALLGFDDRWPLPNLWLGVSIENQQTADDRLSTLLTIPAAVRFASYEPALGPVSLWAFLKTALRDRSLYALKAPEMPGLDWVICGGESGPGARPCALEWLEAVLKQCREADVACFVKQLGAYVVSEERACKTAEEAKRDFGAESRWLWRAGLSSRKGDDMAEWPEALRVRQFPEGR